MRWSEINEGRDAPLYHATTIGGAIAILSSGAIENANERTLDADDPDSPSVISTTRSKHLRFYDQQGVGDSGIAPIQFVIDQRRLSQRYKISPYDYWDSKHRPGGTKDHESEEAVHTNSLPLKYCSAIVFEPLVSDFKSRADDADLHYYSGSTLRGYGEIRKLAKQHNIPIIDKRNQGNRVRESATGGATGAASIATSVGALGGIGVGFDPNGDKGIYQTAKKQKKQKPLMIRRVNEGESKATIGLLCTVKTAMPDADFWLTRKGSKSTVGTPTKEYSPENIGIRVERTDILLPDYLFYMMQFMQQRGMFGNMATGTTQLVSITTGQVKAIALNVHV